MILSVSSWARNLLAVMRRRFSKGICVTGITCVAAFLIGSNVLPQQHVTISFLVRAVEAQQLQTLADPFEQEHPDIHINIVEGPNAADSIENLYTENNSNGLVAPRF